MYLVNRIKKLSILWLSIIVIISSIFVFLYYHIEKSYVCGQFEYIFIDSTGLTRHIIYNNIKEPIFFDDNSNFKMVNAFKALKASILYPNSENGNIVICGCYNQYTHKFIIDSWFIKTPFFGYLTEGDDIITPFSEIKRNSLARSDFDHGEYFNPQDKYFNPSVFIRKRNEYEPIKQYDQLVIDGSSARIAYHNDSIRKILRQFSVIMFVFVLIKLRFLKNIKRKSCRFFIVILIALTTISILACILWIVIGCYAFYFSFKQFYIFINGDMHQVLLIFYDIFQTLVKALLVVFFAQILISKFNNKNSI